MKQIAILNKTLDEILKLSQEILKKSSILYDNEKIIKQTMKSDNKEDAFEDLVYDTINDAKTIIYEKKAFINFVMGKEDESEIPFFQKVWRGDMYGKEGINGLEMLKQDLEEQLYNLNLEKICENY